mgnify:FL=1
MKITVKDGKNFNLHLCFPTRIVLNRFTAFFLPSVLKKQNIHVTTEQILTFSKALRKYKRKHPDWNLVEVSTVKGEYTKIKM